MKPSSRISSLLLFFILHGTLSSQAILDHINLLSGEGYAYVDKDMKRTANGDYFISINANVHKDIYINNEIIETIDYHDSLFTIFDVRKTILLRLDKDFNLITSGEIVNTHHGNSRMAVSADKVFVCYNNTPDNPHIMVNDSIVFTDGDEGGILEFDQNFNFIKRIKVGDNYVNRVEATDTMLYYQIQLDDEYSYYPIEGDTIYNFQKVDGNGVISYGSKTPLLIRYDYKRDKVESFWKFGSYENDGISSIKIDDEEHVIITGSTAAISDFTLDGINVIETETSSSWDTYVAKFDKFGSLIKGFTTPGIRYDIFDSSVAIDSDIYLNGHFFGDSLIIAQDTFTTVGSGIYYRAFMSKVNNEGTLQWTYTFDGDVVVSSFSSFIADENQVTLCLHLSSGYINILGKRYEILANRTFVIVLDAATGEELSYHAFPEGQLTIQNIIANRDNTYDMLIDLSKSMSFDNISLGLFWYSTNYLTTMDFDFITSTHEIDTDKDVTIYPNPVQSNDIITIASSIKDYNNYKIYNMAGKIVQQGLLPLEKDYEVSLSNIASGFYFLMLEGANCKSIHQIVIQ